LRGESGQEPHRAPRSPPGGIDETCGTHGTSREGGETVQIRPTKRHQEPKRGRKRRRLWRWNLPPLGSECRRRGDGGDSKLHAGGFKISPPHTTALTGRFLSGSFPSATQYSLSADTRIMRVLLLPLKKAGAFMFHLKKKMKTENFYWLAVEK
jgi:hypothetical protein